MSSYHEKETERINDKLDEMKSTLPEFVCDYLDSLLEQNKSAKTRLNYAFDCRAFLYYIVQECNVALDDITPEFLGTLTPLDIQRYLTFLTQYRTPEDVAYNKTHPGANRVHKNSSSAKGRKLASLRGLYKFLMLNQYVNENPAKLVEIPVNKRSRDDIVAMDNREVESMIDGAEDGSSLTRRQAQFAKKTQYRDMALLQTMIGTGVRVSELVGINMDDIDMKSRSILVYRKEGKAQRVYMTDDAAAAIDDYIRMERKPADGESALFLSPRTGLRLSVRSVERIVKKYTANITNQKIHAHTLRATYATNLYANSDDINLVADALGHSGLGSVSKYTKSGEMNRKRAPGLLDYNKKDD